MYSLLSLISLVGFICKLIGDLLKTNVKKLFKLQQYWTINELKYIMQRHDESTIVAILYIFISFVKLTKYMTRY